jgi:hypothetical protein
MCSIMKYPKAPNMMLPHRKTPPITGRYPGLLFRPCPSGMAARLRNGSRDRNRKDTGMENRPASAMGSKLARGLQFAPPPWMDGWWAQLQLPVGTARLPRPVPSLDPTSIAALWLGVAHNRQGTRTTAPSHPCCGGPQPCMRGVASERACMPCHAPSVWRRKVPQREPSIIRRSRGWCVLLTR